MEDIVIIGAGITGSFLAYDLAHYHCKVTVIDRESDVANQTSMANSAIIHTGYDPEDGTLKARLNCRGAVLYPKICQQIEADYLKTGAYILATDEDQIATLNELLDRAVRRNIRAEILNRDQLLKEEPNLSDQVVAGLSVPDTAVVTPWQVAIHLMRDAICNGVTLHLNCEVRDIQADPEGFSVVCNDRTIRTKWIINAAGNGAQKIAEMVGKSPFTIHHYRGQYYVLNQNCHDFVHHICYPVPTSQGKGVLAVPTVHGNILLGPTREQCLPEDTSTTAEGLAEVSQKLSRIVKNVPMNQVIRVYSGIRASSQTRDFYIEASENCPHLIHAAGIDSPGLASAPAVSEYIVNRWFKDQLKVKETFDHVSAPVRMADLSLQQRNEKIRENPLYGDIVCKCEKISRQEILDAIRIPLGATTVKGVKKRVRPGMGKCQGGFCQSEVALILAEELGIPVEKVLYDETGSELGWEAK